MTEETTESTGDDFESEHIDLQELDVNLKGTVLDLYLTEHDILNEPVISAVPATLEDSISLHMPIHLQNDEDYEDELALSSDFVSVKMDQESAEQFYEALGDALDQLDQD